MNAPFRPQPEFVRVSRIGDVFHGLSRTTIWRMARDGKITIHRIRGGSFVRIADLVRQTDPRP